jgi:hypothetical protein
MLSEREEDSMLILNALTTIKPYFKSFKAWRLVLIGTSSARFKLSDSLWQENVAFAYPYQEYMYFKGSPEIVLRKIKELVSMFDRGELFLQEENPGLEQIMLGVDNEVIIKPIVYASIKNLLKEKGFIHPYRKTKKAIPEINRRFEKMGLIEYLSDDIVVLHGLRYMFQVRRSGYGIAWFDIYSPAYSLTEGRILPPKRLRSLGLSEEYKKRASLSPEKRLEMLNSILSLLAANESTITLRFPDGDVIEVAKDFIILQPMGESE